FLVDIKTRANGFRLDYEGYLSCSQLQDGRRIECVLLRFDLGPHAASPDVTFPGFDPGPVPTYDDPAARLRAVIRVQAETCNAKDEYLASILSEEANRSATLALVKKGTPPEESSEVDAYVEQAAQSLGVAEEWERGQSIIQETKRPKRTS